MKVHNFSYNGLFGSKKSSYASFTADFKEWTNDPGIAKCICSDGIERLIPTFALEGFDDSMFPEQTYENGMVYIGIPCSSW